MVITHSVVANMINCNIVVKKFNIHSFYKVIRDIPFGKYMNPLTLPDCSE